MNPADQARSAALAPATRPVGGFLAVRCPECACMLHFRWPDPYVPDDVVHAAHLRMTLGLRMHLRFSCR